ncbi:hypothetical protein KCP78_18910 [Salmonella enterica subsp. enterica]|nr:hypothetical protein KCP78_18910 [Salmonella enterica subsp. enterica]
MWGYCHENSARHKRTTTSILILAGSPAAAYRIQIVSKIRMIAIRTTLIKFCQPSFAWRHLVETICQRAKRNANRLKSVKPQRDDFIG